jgi:hypothetical protein
MTSLKLALVGLAAAGAAVFASVASGPQPAHAVPISVVALNSEICVTLGVAFGGIPGLNAAVDCTGMEQQSRYQDYATSLTKRPLPVHTTASDFAGIDRDQNQVHEQQQLIVIAFVDDQQSVRFTSPVGNWNGLTGGKEVFCESFTYDPDCDAAGAPGAGDGVVVARLIIQNPSIDPTGAYTLHVVQEGVAIPVNFTIVGKPEQITLTPLFGKDTISVGATPPTAQADVRAPESTPDAPGFVKADQVQPTDCNFEATLSGVLGANSRPEKVVVIAKALDNEGNEVVGALLEWEHPIIPTTYKGSLDLPPFAPAGATYLHVGPTLQAGVALPQTPTLDLGSGVGIGFPQFVCGLQEPGTFETRVWFSGTGDSSVTQPPGRNEVETLKIKVVGPAEKITLTADPPQIDCNGTSSSKVTATVTTADGEPVANGLDVNFSVVALGTANPLKADSSGGSASTTVTPLAGAGTLGPKGVTVTVSVDGARRGDIFTRTHDLELPLTDALRGFVGEPLAPPLYVFPPPEVQKLESSILVACSGSLGPGGEQPAGGAEAGAAPSGGRAGIRGPDTGSGGASAPGAAGWLTLVALAAGAAVLGGARLALRRVR